MDENTDGMAKLISRTLDNEMRIALDIAANDFDIWKKEQTATFLKEEDELLKNWKIQKTKRELYEKKNSKR